LDSPRARHAEELREKEKEIEKEKRAAAERAAANNGRISPLRHAGEDERQPRHGGQSADDGDVPLSTPHKFGPPSRTMDSPTPGGRVETGPQPAGRDTPQGLGGDNDPVMETPQP
jgi:hypothetical protein